MRVFTQEDLLTLRIPTPANFEEAYRLVAQGLSEIYLLQSETAIPLRMIGAVVIGSFAKRSGGGEMKCTSDIDIMVFYEDHEADARAIHAFAQTHRGRYTRGLDKAIRYNVPIKLYNVFHSKIASGDSRHTKQFLKHSVVSLQGFGGKFPSGLIVGDKSEVAHMCNSAPSFTREQCRQYITSKQEKIRDGCFSWGGLSQKDSAKLYADMFTSPFHAARQMFDVLGLSYVDTRTGVIEALNRISETHALSELAEMIDRYAKACAGYRRSKGRSTRPELAMDEVYDASMSTLSGLQALL